MAGKPPPFLIKEGKFATKNGKFVVVPKGKDPSDCECCGQCPQISCEWGWDFDANKWVLTNPDGTTASNACKEKGCDCEEPDYTPDLTSGIPLTEYTACGKPKNCDCTVRLPASTSTFTPDDHPCGRLLTSATSCSIHSQTVRAGVATVVVKSYAIVINYTFGDFNGRCSYCALQTETAKYTAYTYDCKSQQWSKDDTAAVPPDESTVGQFGSCDIFDLPDEPQAPTPSCQPFCEDNGGCEDPFRDCECADAGAGWTTAEDRIKPDGSVYRSCCPPGTKYVGNDECEYTETPGTLVQAPFFNEIIECRNSKCRSLLWNPNPKAQPNPLP